MTRLPLTLAAVLCLGAAPMAAQVATVDEGSFTITRNGQKVGREEFRIRRTPAAAGAEFVASATVAYGDRRLSPDLRTDAAGAPLAYRVEVRVGDATEERLTGQVGRGRFTAMLKTSRGESTREYVMPDGALVLDDDIYHQYYFVGVGGRSGATPVVVPRRSAQVNMRVESKGSETVSVAGRSVAGTHFVVSDPGAGARDVWLDGSGRVLKVAIPSRGLVAERDELPR
jgi:hypothetical protein